MNFNICAVFFILFGATSAHGNRFSHENQIDIIFSQPESFKNKEMREALYVTSELLKVSAEFRNNPNTFKEAKLEPRGFFGVFSSPEWKTFTPQSSYKPLEDRLAVLEAGIEGLNISESLVFDALTTAVGMSGPKGVILSKTLTLAGKAYDRNSPGRTPLVDKVNLVGLGSVLQKLKVEDPNAYSMIRDQISKRMGFDISGNLDFHPAVLEFNNRAEEKESHELIKEIKEKLEENFSVTNESELSNVEVNTDEAKISKFKNLRSEVAAGANTASMLLALAGEHEASAKIVVAGTVVDKLLILQAGQNNPVGSPLNLGMMVAAQNYVEIASMTIGLFSEGGDSFETAVLKQLKAIAEMIGKLTEKVDKGFLEINTKLDLLDSKLGQAIAEVRAYGKIQASSLESLKLEINKIEYILNSLEIEKQLEAADSVRRNCLVDTSEYQSLDSETIRDFKNDCLNKIVNAASKSITTSYLGIQPTNLSQLSSYVSGRQKRDALPILIHELSKKDGADHPFYDEHTSQGLVDPKLWLKHSSQFISLVEKFPMMHHKIFPEDFSRVIQAGQNYIDVQKNLIADNKSSLRLDIINKFTNSYKNQTLELLEQVRDSAYDSIGASSGETTLGVKNIYGYNATLPINQQRSHATWSPNETDLVRCPELKYGISNLWNVTEYINDRMGLQEPTLATADELDHFINENNKWNAHNTRFRFLKLPTSFEQYLPDEVTWLLQFKRSKVSICISKIHMEDITIVAKEVSSGFGSGIMPSYEVKYSGKVEVKISYDTVLTHTASFPVNRSYSRGALDGVVAYQSVFPYQVYMDAVGFPLGLQSVPTSASFFGVPEISRGRFTSSISRGPLQQIVSSWDQEAFRHFSERNDLFKKNLMKSHSALEMLFYVLELGVNNNLHQKGNLQNYIFNNSGLMPSLNYVGQMIFEKKGLEEIEEDLDYRVNGFFESLQVLQDEASVKGLPIFQESTELKGQIDKLRFIEKYIHRPLSHGAREGLSKK